MWTVRKFFIDNYNVDPPIFNGDQMPLHRNESSGQKTLNIKGLDTFVKENHMLSRERVTAYTQVCSDPNVTLQPEFVFKGKGTRTKLNPPEGVHFQWSPKGTYREDPTRSKPSVTFQTDTIFSHPKIMRSTFWMTTVFIICRRSRMHC